MEEMANQVLQPIQQLLDRLDAKTVFGEPTAEGDVTVIPVADVMVGFGYGYGGGPAGRTGDVEVQATTEGGGGGGGGGHASPRGYLKITADGVRYEPITDQGKIALAGIFLSAWSVFWIARTIRAFVSKDR